ncbi:hypothetical protein QQ045_017031 [Rhodiola kirilowii]
MCPLRLILIFLSATLAGFFVLRNLKAQPDLVNDDAVADPSVDSSSPPPPRSTKMCVAEEVDYVFRFARRSDRRSGHALTWPADDISGGI